MPFAGEFETHVTLAAGADPAHARACAARLGVKFLHIVLDRGAEPSQPMVTRHGLGTLAAELVAARSLADEFTAAGFGVTRVKIEAAPGNAGVPRADAEAAAHPGRYFEHHVKLALGPGDDLAALAGLAEAHAARLSRNALRDRGDGLRERFLTQRCAGVGRATAHARLDALLAQLAAAGHVPLEVEAEFVVFDSNLAADAGWLDQGGIF